MARTLSPALPHAAGFALLKPAERPQLDPARIATLSGTLAVNLIAMGLLMLPLTLPPPAPLADIDTDPELIWIEREKPRPVEVEVVHQPPKPEVAPTIQPPRPLVQAPVEIPSTPVLTESASEPAVETPIVDAAGPIESITPASVGPAPMQLQYAVAPAPAYPRAALRARITGTVMLQVLVDIDGKPLEVSVAQSSGNRELDAAARAQVLKRWTFRPAMQNGRAVQALGMVPIEFRLQ